MLELAWLAENPPSGELTDGARLSPLPLPPVLVEALSPSCSLKTMLVDAVSGNRPGFFSVLSGLVASKQIRSVESSVTARVLARVSRRLVAQLMASSSRCLANQVLSHRGHQEIYLRCSARVKV